MPALVAIKSRRDAECHYGNHSYIGSLLAAWRQAEDAALMTIAAMKPTTRQPSLLAIQTARQKALEAIVQLVPYEVDVTEAYKQPLLPSRLQ